MQYYAKSKNAFKKQATVKEHLSEVTHLASTFGNELGLESAAFLAGSFHDFGKYSQSFQNVLVGLESGIDHAIPGAWLLTSLSHGKPEYRPIVEAINGHHDGLIEYSSLEGKLRDIASGNILATGNAEKKPALRGNTELRNAYSAFRDDFPDFRSLPNISAFQGTPLESMLYTRMIFSCLVDADYSASAQNNDASYLERTGGSPLEPANLLQKLYAFRNDIRKNSTSNPALNQFRDEVFDQCGEMGGKPEGLFTLTAPTGTGKTLALLHFALRHCLAHGKKRIIIVLPFLTLAEQNAATYAKIVPDVLIDHSQSDLPEEARELAARWTAPVIITTSVRFFETLFADRPTACRKLHNIANSVVIFDEAQSLPASLTGATLQAVNELCRRYHTTMVFSTATQPDYSTLKDVQWQPQEILPDHVKLFQALQRVDVDWRIESETNLTKIAEEMAAQSSVCAIVNLRRHARDLAKALADHCSENEIFFLTTDLCPAHRSEVVETIKTRLKEGLPCRVVATQCIEAGVDLDFDVLFRALAPLDAIIQAAGRCNRNGRLEKGQVIVFDPEDSCRPYPDDWYLNAATTVREMQPPFSIHVPANIREYYRRLFADEKGNENLRKAIEGRAFADTAKHYKLISNQGAQVIVPFSGERERYEYVVKTLRNAGITGALLKEAAPITLTCFAKNLEKYAEMLPFAGCKHGRNGKEARPSNVYLLLPQYEDLYSEQYGLCFPNEETGNYIL